MKKNVLVGIGIFVGLALIIAGILILPTPTVSSIERYESIPEMPDDFYAYTREIWGGAYVELCDLPEEYWRRPEFYGDSWKISKANFYDNPNYKMWGVYGQGNVPREIGYSFENLKKGDEFTLCSFFHNGFGVWTYQGFELVPVGENEYFDIEITPNEFIMAPTFPVFEKEWVKKITITIKVKETPPKGTYVFGFTAEKPSDDFSRQATRDTLNMEVDKDLYMQDCVKSLGDTIRCENLIALREKKYVAGGSYRPSVNPLTISFEVK